MRTNMEFAFLALSLYSLLSLNSLSTWRVYSLDSVFSLKLDGTFCQHPSWCLYFPAVTLAIIVHKCPSHSSLSIPHRKPIPLQNQTLLSWNPLGYPTGHTAFVRYSSITGSATAISAWPTKSPKNIRMLHSGYAHYIKELFWCFLSAYPLKSLMNPDHLSHFVLPLL